MNTNIVWKNGNKISINEIIKVEIELGVKFPEKYVEIVSKYNGGYPKPDTFLGETIESGFSELIKIEEMVKFKEISSTTYHRFINDDQEELLRYISLVPFAFDAGGGKLCFDYYNNETPTVIFLTDIYDIDFVANSFEELLENLYEFVEDVE